MQPFQGDLQAQIQETHRIERRTQEQPLLQNTYIRNETNPAATAAHTRYLSSPAAATSHGKTQGFVLWLPPHNNAHATFMQPFQCDLQPQLQETHRTTHTGTTIAAKHIEGSPLPIVTTSHRPHLPSSPLPFITTSLRHHFPSSPLPIVTTSLHRHFPSSPIPFVTTLSHSFLFFCYILLLYCDVMYHPSS